jgi:hypothetical protein
LRGEQLQYEKLSVRALPAMIVMSALPVTVADTASAAVTICMPAVLRVTPLLKVCAPLSVLMKV